MTFKHMEKYGMKSSDECIEKKSSFPLKLEHHGPNAPIDWTYGLSPVGQSSIYSFLWYAYYVSHTLLATGTTAVSQTDWSLPLWSILCHRQSFVKGLLEIKGMYTSGQYKDRILVTTVVQQWKGCGLHQ